jgi:hypothetical protein
VISIESSGTRPVKILPHAANTWPAVKLCFGAAAVVEFGDVGAISMGCRAGGSRLHSLWEMQIGVPAFGTSSRQVRYRVYRIGREMSCAAVVCGELPVRRYTGVPSPPQVETERALRCPVFSRPGVSLLLLVVRM